MDGRWVYSSLRGDHGPLVVKLYDKRAGAALDEQLLHWRAPG